MSKFSKKIFSGQPATDEDWNQYLSEAHTQASGMTQLCFGAFETSLGPSSYQLLANELRNHSEKSIRLLDLACGDGYLAPMCRKIMRPDSEYIGIDMVASEIKAANSAYGNSTTKFKCAKAQELPEKSDSIDLILCHFALMLMLPLDSVIQEVRRVLKKGGLFSAIIGQKTSKGGIFALMGEETASFIQEKFETAAEFRTGDERLNNLETIRDLFNQNGLEILSLQDFTLKIHAPPTELWSILKHFYVINILPTDTQNELQQMLMSDLEKRKDESGEVLLELPLLKFNATKN